MATVNVQFTDSKKTAICAYFGAPQDPSSYANLGQVDTSDARYMTFYNNQSPQFQIFLPSPN